MPDLMVLAGQVEAEMMHRYAADAPAAARSGLGIAVTRMAGGVVLSASRDPFDYWSRALGFTEPVSHDLIGRVIEFYREQGAPTAVIQVEPSALPPGWEEIRVAHGLEAEGSSLTLGAPVTGLAPRAVTGLAVSRVDEPHAREWAEAAATAFDMRHPAVVAMLAESVHHPGAVPFAAWDGDRIVATANLYLHGQVASLNTGATLPSHRGRGAQSALIAARVEAARAAGVTWVVAETGQPSPGQVNHSLRNLERAGLQILSARQSWRWRA